MTKVQRCPRQPGLRITAHDSLYKPHETQRGAVTQPRSHSKLSGRSWRKLPGVCTSHQVVVPGLPDPGCRLGPGGRWAGHPKADRVRTPFLQRGPDTQLTHLRDRELIPQFRQGLFRGASKSCPAGVVPGQVAPGPALQQDDLAAQGAEPPPDEEAAQAALQREGCQVQDTLPHALQQLVQVLLEEQLRRGGGP